MWEEQWTGLGGPLLSLLGYKLPRGSDFVFLHCLPSAALAKVPVDSCPTAGFLICRNFWLFLYSICNDGKFWPSFIVLE